jgi:predicted phosphoribosyltransferase
MGRIFKGRRDAGSKLAEKLMQYRNNPECIVVGLPRGGIVIAKVISRKLRIPMGIYFVKKIPLPFHEEVAVGAVSEDNYIYVDKKTQEWEGISDKYIEDTAKEKLKLIEKEREKYKRIEKRDLKNMIVIVADDGIATGSTMIAAVKSIKNAKAKKVVVAAPVSSSRAFKKLKNIADELVFVEVSVGFMAVAQYYRDFHQLSDEDIEYILNDGY